MMSKIDKLYWQQRAKVCLRKGLLQEVGKGVVGELRIRSDNFVSYYTSVNTLFCLHRLKRNGSTMFKQRAAFLKMGSTVFQLYQLLHLFFLQIL